jgi:hypothetical protein
MNEKDKKDCLLFEIINIYDNTIRPFMIIFKNKKGEITPIFRT